MAGCPGTVMKVANEAGETCAAMPTQTTMLAATSAVEMIFTWVAASALQIEEFMATLQSLLNIIATGSLLVFEMDQPRHKLI
jgi:hypothetical protein